MSGRYNGLQAMVAAENDLATLITCAGHSLNLAGKAAAECCGFLRLSRGEFCLYHCIHTSL